jgi:hypothetical protein
MRKPDQTVKSRFAELLPEAKGCALRQNESGDTAVLPYNLIALSGVEMRVLPDLPRGE